MAYDILTIGSATEDVFLMVPEAKTISRRSFLDKIGFTRTDGIQCLPLGAKLEVKKMVRQSGGGATNAAVTFSRQGLKTAAIFKVGQDFFGSEIITELKKEKINTQAAITKVKPTGYSTVLVTADGSRTILVSRGAETLLSEKDIPSSLKTIWAYINPSGIPFDVIYSLVRRLKSAGTLIAFNPSRSFLELGFKKLTPLLEAANVILINREEASFLTHQPYRDERAIFRKFDELVPGLAVMTEGPKGLLVSDGRHLWKAGIFPGQKPIDRTGAGDAFGSGFVAGLLATKESCVSRNCHNKNIKYAIRLGSANATSVVENIGAKTGILTKRQFASPRWRHLPISYSVL